MNVRQRSEVTLVPDEHITALGRISCNFDIANSYYLKCQIHYRFRLKRPGSTFELRRGWFCFHLNADFGLWKCQKN